MTNQPRVGQIREYSPRDIFFYNPINGFCGWKEPQAQILINSKWFVLNRSFVLRDEQHT